VGFNKRYISIEKLQNFIKNGYEVSKAFNTDAIFFMDEKSHEIYRLYMDGVDNNVLVNIILNETDTNN
jgi:hypothetical protein